MAVETHKQAFVIKNQREDIRDANEMACKTIIVEKDENSIVSGEATTITLSDRDTTTVSDRSGSSLFDYSYLVLFAAFIAYMLASLLSGCFGVVFDNLESELGLSKSKVALIGALLSSLDNLLGPIASAFINRYGCRKTSIIGGFITACGIIGSAYVTDFWLLGLLMGGVSGFGSSLVVVSTVVVATYYFEDKPSFASGFVISGGSLGPTIFPLIIIKLNELYGRSGCFLILGGLVLNIIVCGALFRPLDWELDDYTESIEGSGVNDEEECDDDDDVDDEIEEENIEEEDVGDVVEDQKSMLESSEIKGQNENYCVCEDLDANKIGICDKDENEPLNKINCQQFDSFLTPTIENKLNTSSNNETIFQKMKNFFRKSTNSNRNVNQMITISSPIPLLRVDIQKVNNRHHHNHHHSYHHHNIPNFMNHFPLNLRNYYYKSLINLNTRLLASNTPPTQTKVTNSPLGASIIEINNSCDVDADCTTKLSTSCPNLSPSVSKTSNMNQLLTVNDLNYRLQKYQHLIKHQQHAAYHRHHHHHHHKHNNQYLRPQQQQHKPIYKKQIKQKEQQIQQLNNESTANRTTILEAIKKFIRNLFKSIIETLKLFHIIEFTIFATCNFILDIFYEASFYFINSYMTENNHTQNKAGIVTVATGIAGIFASLAYGYIGDLKCLNWTIIYSSSLVLTAICNFVIPFFINNYALTMLCMILMSVFISVTDVLVPIICVHTVGNDDFVSAYGLIFFCKGIASLVGPPLLGKLCQFVLKFI